MLAAAALSYLNPAVFTATKNRNSCASVSLLYPEDDFKVARPLREFVLCACIVVLCLVHVLLVFDVV